MNFVSMYYANLTNIDLAMIMPDGQLRGDSFNLHLDLSGQEDPVEGVLIDFSTAKKKIKGWIDDHLGQGFDHKLWVFVHPEAKQTIEIDGELIDSFDKLTVNKDSNPSIVLTTPYTTITAPANCFRFIEVYEGSKFTSALCFEKAQEAIADYLEDKFKTDGAEVAVEARLTNNFSYPAFACTELQGFTFRYTHGLKHSTSFGCQNIAHGHISYIAFREEDQYFYEQRYNPGTREFYKEQIQNIINHLDNKVFVWAENAKLISNIEHGMPDQVLISYECSRGTMSQLVDADKCIVLSVETTVEHIAQYVATKFRQELEAMKMNNIYVSEGLEKGGIAYLEHTYKNTEHVF